MWFSPFPCSIPPLRPKYSPQHPIFKNPQPMFLLQCELASFTTIQNRQNCSSIYLNLYTFRLQNGRQNILHQMIGSILWLQSALNFFLNIILTQIFPIYLNCSTLSKELLSVCILWLLHSIWSWDMTIYLVVSAFISSPSVWDGFWTTRQPN
jgi:hypothetical protein